MGAPPSSGTPSGTSTALGDRETARATGRTRGCFDGSRSLFRVSLAGPATRVAEIGSSFLPRSRGPTTRGPFFPRASGPASSVLRGARRPVESAFGPIEARPSFLQARALAAAGSRGEHGRNQSSLSEQSDLAREGPQTRKTESRIVSSGFSRGETPFKMRRRSLLLRRAGRKGREKARAAAADAPEGAGPGSGLGDVQRLPAARRRAKRRRKSSPLRAVARAAGTPRSNSYDGPPS
jgi:hypothetical protein